MADELNFQLPQEGFDSYLYGIIPDDQAVLAGAFSVSMQQVRNIDKVDVPSFAKVAYNTESTVGLPLTAGTDIPTDTPLSTAAKIKTAIGSGIYGTFTMSNFYGAMSGLPYPWVNLYDKIKELETQALYSIYQNLYLAVKWEQASATWDGSSFTYTNQGGGYGRGTGAPAVTVDGNPATAIIGTDPNDLSTFGKIISISYSGPAGGVSIDPPPGPGWPGMNTVVQGYIDAANNEIQSITTSSVQNFQNSKVLNTLWNITGIALKHEQRARYVAVPPVLVPWDSRYSNYPTSMYVFVDSIPDFAKKTAPHMEAQTLEHISDLLTTGGQSIVAMMRQERNQDRLNNVGIELDNNLVDRLDVDLERQLMLNGTLSGAVEGIESPDGLIYTLPAWPENTNPVAYWDCELNQYRMVTNLTPGTVLPILDGSGCPIVNTEVPINEGPLPEPPVNIFVNENPLPPQVNSEYTGTTLKPSTYDIPDAIDKVIECNCDCWVN